MKKINTYYTIRQIDYVQKIADKNGITFSEALRRVLDKGIKEK